MSLLLTTAGLIALQGATIVQAPTPDESGLAAEYGSGVCRISVFGKDGDGERIRAQFARRLRDGNLSVAMYGPFISKFRGRDPNENHPVTVTFDTGATQPSRSGGYDTGGFRESAWGGWGPGAASDATYAQMKDANSFTIRMEGKSYGPFTWEGKGALYDALQICEEQFS